jgi:hypothetical protein
MNPIDTNTFNDLWINLSKAQHAIRKGESILERISVLPWESKDPDVKNAWNAIIRPENIFLLEHRLSQPLNDHAREYAEKALQQCKERREKCSSRRPRFAQLRLNRGVQLTEAQMEEEIAEVVRKHGWYAASISDHQPPFLYTIGIMQTFKHPELIMFGLKADDSHALFSQLVRNIHTGQSYTEPNVYTITIGDDEHRVGFRRVHPTQHPLYLGYAMGYCRYIGRMGELEVMQTFWSDAVGKFPFDVGCNLGVYQLQPRLDIGLTPHEVSEWQRQCVA